MEMLAGVLKATRWLLVICGYFSPKTSSATCLQRTSSNSRFSDVSKAPFPDGVVDERRWWSCYRV